jgi:hypothetical protein
MHITDLVWKLEIATVEHTTNEDVNGITRHADDVPGLGWDDAGVCALGAAQA